MASVHLFFDEVKNSKTKFLLVYKMWLSSFIIRAEVYNSTAFLYFPCEFHSQIMQNYEIKRFLSTKVANFQFKAAKTVNF